jgi:hypothetical protein
VVVILYAGRTTVLVMAPPNPLADWERVGDRFYRKVRVYDAVFDEDLELENYIVTGAPYGGAVGISLRLDQDWDAVPRTMTDCWPF